MAFCLTRKEDGCKVFKCYIVKCNVVLIMMGLIVQDVFVEGRNIMAAFIQKASQFILGYVSLY